jgi:predicted RNase H-like HicB family nuclease
VKAKQATHDASEPAPGFVHTIFATLRRALGAENKRERIDGPPPMEQGTWELTFLVQPDDCDGGFVAECPEVPGAAGQGETEDAALHDLLDAINAMIAVRLEQRFDEVERTGAASDRPLTVSVTF